MNNVIKVKFRKRKRLTSVLGLALDGSRLDGVVLRRSNGSVQLQQTFSVALTLDPLTAAPELVGREIRNHLDAAGVRERHCVVAVPLRWALAAHAELPQLSAEDAASLLQIEAERSFPCDVNLLRLAESRCALSEGRQYVTMAGIPESQLTTLEQVLVAAKLKPVSFSLGIAALQPPQADKSNGVLALKIGESHVGLQISAAGGVVSLRALEGAIENEAGRPKLHADLVARETRITLGQLIPELRDAIKRVRIFGPADVSRELANEMELRFRPMGLDVDVVSAYPPGEFGVQLPMDASVSPAFSIATRALTDDRPLFEFLPPKPTVIEQLVAKYSSGKMRTASALGAAVLVIVVGLFGFQQVQLILLNSQWNKMSQKVTELNGLQDKIRQYRPWFDETFPGLSILRELTLAFPENGSVTAKSIEIRDGNKVTCTGTTRDNTALYRMLNQLGAIREVSDLTLLSTRGNSPKQFSFEFRWVGGGGQ